VLDGRGTKKKGRQFAAPSVHANQRPFRRTQ